MSAINKNKEHDKSFKMNSHSQIELNPKTDNLNTYIKTRSTHRTPLDHFGDMRLVNPEQESHTDAELTLKKLIDINENYLSEKVKVSDVPTPPKFSHKIPSKTGHSEYNRKFHNGGRAVSLYDTVPQRDNSGSILKLPNHIIASYQSTYHKDFAAKERAAQEQAGRAKQYERSQAPNFAQSSYQRDYGPVTQSPTASAKRMEVRLMGGGKLNDNTTYKQYYRLRTQSYHAPNPIIHKDNRIFVKMDNPQQSNYREAFGGRTGGKAVESCKPVQKYLSGGRQKYRTQYNQQFVRQTIAKKREFECLSPEQLKSYVMTILND